MDGALVHDARLPGFSGKPIFLDALIQFQAMCRAKFLYDLDILAAAQKCGGLSEAAINTRTTDGHRWYCSFTFESGNSSVCLLFPFVGGSDSPQHKLTPRHPAAYIEGGLDENFVIELLKKLEAALEEVRNEKHKEMLKRKRA